MTEKKHEKYLKEALYREYPPLEGGSKSMISGRGIEN